MSIVVVTLAVGYEKWIIDMIRFNREKMCSAQGLELKFCEVTTLGADWPLSWHKILVLLEELDAGRDVLWIDADAIIVSRIPVEKLKENIACAMDRNWWNLGFGMCRVRAAGFLERC